MLLIEDGSLRGSNLGMLTIQYLFLTGIDENFIVGRIGFCEKWNSSSEEDILFALCYLYFLPKIYVFLT